MLGVKQPDIAIISEANILIQDQEHEVYIQGYKLILPKTMNTLGNCRIAVLVRVGIEVKLLDKFMNTSVASVWLKISCKGRKSLHLGACYREHKHIRQTEPNNSGELASQINRWKLFVDQWVRASMGADTVVIGDLNIDMNKWLQPDPDHLAMTNILKNRIETEGFHQTIIGDTRFWKDTPSSLIDHCWHNCPGRIMKSENIPEAQSDHNIIRITIRVWGNESTPREIMARDRSNFCIKTYQDEVKKSGLEGTTRRGKY